MNRPQKALQEPAQLFRHLAKYRVVICTMCRHAIPPRAVNRHLKEIHGVHYSLRPHFVKYVESLDVCDPEEVAPPGDNDFPIPELPVLYGLRCNFRDCGHLCLTEKRMKNHFASIRHPYIQGEQPWSSVPLQTFFRGSLLKYFSRSAQFDNVDARVKCAEKGDAACRDWSRTCESANELSQLPTPFPSSRKSRIDGTAESLLRHYQVVTYATIATDVGDKDFWQRTVVELARNDDFLLLAILSLTSLHLAHLNPDRRSELAMQATSYQDRALPIFREAIAAPTRDNCHAIIVFHHLLVLYSIAADQQDDDLFLITRDGDDVIPYWLGFIRSACVILCDVWDWVETGPCQTLASAWEAPFHIDKAFEVSALELLLAAIPPSSSDMAWTATIVELYHEAASELVTAFACSESLPHQFTTWDALRIWPFRVSTEFMALLRKEHPCALILLAHYTTLLRRIDYLWYFRGRADGLLRTISRKLDPYWHAFIPPALTLAAT